MRISLLTNILLCGVLFSGIFNSRAVAQTKALQKDTTALYAANSKKLSFSYKIIPGGNYVFINTVNGHISDSRANTGGTASAPRNASGTGVRTDASPVQEAPDGNSGFHVQLTNYDNVYAQTGFYFVYGATDKYLQGEDAVQLNGPAPMVYLSSYSSDGVNVCINTLSDYALGKRVRLYVNGAVSGQYTLSLPDFNEIDTASYNIFLVDHQQKDSTDMVHKTCAFYIEAGDTTSFGAYRFEISIDHKPVAGYSLSNFSGEKVTAGVQLSWTAVDAGNYTGYTLQKLNNNDGAEDSLYFVQSDNETNTFSFTDEHPIIGNNVYRLKQNGINGAITYSSQVTVGYSNSVSNNSTISNLSLYPNPAKSTMNASISTTSTSTVSYQAYIYNSMGSLVKHEPVGATKWIEDLSSYKSGLYFIQVKDNNGSIIAQSKFVKSE